MVIGPELIGKAWHRVHISVPADSQDVQTVPLATPEIDHGMPDPGIGDLRFINGMVRRQARIIIYMVITVPYSGPVSHLLFRIDDLLMARMDSSLIVQVLINLINNAVKYTPENASITIGAEREGSMVVLWVEDEGQGIPEGDEDKVFELFYTGVKRFPDSRRGIGLGLALCRSIVAAAMEKRQGRIKTGSKYPEERIMIG